MSTIRIPIAFVAGGPYSKPQQTMEIEVDIRFAPRVPESMHTKARIKAQRDFVEDFIRDKMNTEEYKRGFRHASFGMPLHGYRAVIGSPVEFALMEKSFATLKFGNLEPSEGYVHPLTFMQLYDRVFAPGDVRIGPLAFWGARIHPDADLDPGVIVWQYGEKVP